MYKESLSSPNLDHYDFLNVYLRIPVERDVQLIHPSILNLAFCPNCSSSENISANRIPQSFVVLCSGFPWCHSPALLSIHYFTSSDVLLLFLLSVVFFSKPSARHTGRYIYPLTYLLPPSAPQIGQVFFW